MQTYSTKAAAMGTSKAKVQNDWQNDKMPNALGFCFFCLVNTKISRLFMFCWLIGWWSCDYLDTNGNVGKINLHFIALIAWCFDQCFILAGLVVFARNNADCSQADQVFACFAQVSGLKSSPQIVFADTIFSECPLWINLPPSSHPIDISIKPLGSLFTKATQASTHVGHVAMILGVPLSFERKIALWWSFFSYPIRHIQFNRQAPAPPAGGRNCKQWSFWFSKDFLTKRSMFF